MLKTCQIRWSQTILLLSISLFLGSFNIALAEDAANTNSHFGNLQFSTAKKQQIAREQIVEGVVEAVNRATLKAQTAGQIEAINFDVDDFVTEGQLLVRIKATEQQASTAQIKAQVSEAQAYYKQAKTEFDRVNALFKKGALSASRRDQARAALNAARARLNAARAATKRSKTQQEYTEIKAPYSGVVVERHIEEGEVADIGTPVMTGMSLDQLRIITYVAQSQIAAVRKHQKARIFLTNGAGKIRRYDAVKLTIAPQADAKSHTFKVRVDLPEKTPDLFPGMFVKIAFTIGQESVLLLPNSAVAYRGEIRGAYVKNQQGELSMVPIRIGSRHGDKIEVLSGIQPNDKFALDPVAAAVALKEHYATVAKQHGER